MVYSALHGFARQTMAAGSLLTIFRPSAAGRRSALKSSSRFWFFLRHQKEQRIK
jgi:hypothetical protein